jgi:PilZ domain
MEHRWGRRCELYRMVLLRTAGGEALSAHLRDISLSGAYLESTASVPLMQPIDVELRIGFESHAHSCAVRGCVVRRDARGIAIEWCEFAPEAVSALLERDARAPRVQREKLRVGSS